MQTPLKHLRKSPFGLKIYLYGSSVVHKLLAVLCVTWVVIDVITNNWELNDYIGNGHTFFTPVLGITGKDDLMNGQFAFPKQMSPTTISNVGQFMLNSSLASMYARDGSKYVITAGSHLVADPGDDTCPDLIKTYVLPNVNDTIRLGVLIDKIRYIRGNTLTNFFMGVKESAPSGTKHDALLSMGYLPGRLDCDSRLTMPVKIPPHGVRVTANISMYRYYVRSFCTGCDAVTELGLDVCSITYSYNSSASTLTVHKSESPPGSRHLLGMILARSGLSKGSLFLRGFCVAFVLIGYTTSQKTVRWTDGTTLTNYYKKLLYMITPSLYRYRSSTFSFSSFCFNSDIFVVVYLVSVLLDEKACAMYSRVMFKWNQGTGTSWWITWRLLSMSFRLLWFNCFMTKCIKWFANFVSMTRYTGTNRIVAFFNFSSVTYVYIGSVILMLRNDFIDYGNLDNVSLSSTTQNLDGITLDVFDSWFIRAYPALALVLLINLIFVLALDHFINRKWWARVKMNSLGRQNIYNSTSILCDLDYNFVEVEGYKGQAIAVRTRSLCTIQWFLSSHNLRFGLPEQPKAIRNMIATCLKRPEQRLSSVSEILSRHATFDERRRKGQTVEVSSEVAHEMYLVAQDREGNIHLYNAKKHEIQALSMEVKILADANYIIA